MIVLVSKVYTPYEWDVIEVIKKYELFINLLIYVIYFMQFKSIWLKSNQANFIFSYLFDESDKEIFMIMWRRKLNLESNNWMVTRM